jgi:DNA invertase Pin-like site-specific DNA recombinase
MWSSQLRPHPSSDADNDILAELEQELGRERHAAAKASRKARNLPIGRPRRLTADKIDLAERMRAAREPVPVIAEHLGISRPTLYRLLAERANG